MGAVGCQAPVLNMPEDQARLRTAQVHHAEDSSLVAFVQGPNVTIYGSPGRGRVLTLPNPWLLNGVSTDPIPQVFLVVADRPDGWVEVLLPQRPNGSVGWIRPGAARLLVDDYRIVISLRRHTIVVRRGGVPIYSGPVATGAPGTPTPTGLFSLRVLLHTGEPSSPYGPYAYGLSAHSDALTSFDGGDAEIGIHGNNDAALLGESVSHGCVRMDNTEISVLASLLPLGTPVEIDG
jgi:L,D-transpeptidase catalytic domain